MTKNNSKFKNPRLSVASDMRLSVTNTGHITTYIGNLISTADLSNSTLVRHDISGIKVFVRASADVDESLLRNILARVSTVSVRYRGIEQIVIDISEDRFDADIIKSDNSIIASITSRIHGNARLASGYSTSVADVNAVTKDKKKSSKLTSAVNQAAASSPPTTSAKQVSNAQPDRSQEAPRWSEQNRDKKQVKLRLPPDLIDTIDAKASKTGIDRNAWITLAIHKALEP